MNEEKLDLEDNTKEFFNVFNIEPKEITLEDRELLEEILLEEDWKLEYTKDQWCCITATKGELKYTGEGNTFTVALLALYILIHPLLEQSTIDTIKKELLKIKKSLFLLHELFYNSDTLTTDWVNVYPYTKKELAIEHVANETNDSFDELVDYFNDNTILHNGSYTYCIEEVAI